MERFSRSILALRFQTRTNLVQTATMADKNVQMHLYFGFKATESHSEVLSPFTLAIFQKLSRNT